MMSSSGIAARESRDATGKASSVSIGPAKAGAAREPSAASRVALRGPAIDNLGDKYTAMADDAAAAETKREASVLFSVAESNLRDNEDPEEAMKGATQALGKFKEAGDLIGAADSSRLIVHTYKAKADAGYWKEGETYSAEQLKLGEDFARGELAKFQEAGDKAGEAAMLLSIAEVIYVLPKDYKFRAEAMENATKAKEAFAELGSGKLQGLSDMVLFRIHSDKLEYDKAQVCATEAVKLFKEEQDSLNHARALCALAEAKHNVSAYPEAIKSLKAAVKSLKEYGSKKIEAAALLLLGEIYLINEKYKEALPPAKEALTAFQELSYGKGFQPAANTMVVDILTQLGESSKAINWAKDELAKVQDAGDKRGEVLLNNGLILAHVGGDLYAEGEMDEALKVADASLAIVRELGDKDWEAQVLHTMLQLHVRAEDYSKATEVSSEAQALLTDTGDEAQQVSLLDTVAAMQEMQNDLEAAAATRDLQRDLCQKMNEKVREGVVMLKVSAMWAKVLPLTVENMDKAMAAAREAQALFQEVEDKGGEGAALQMVAEIAIAGGEGSKKKEPAVAMAAATQAQELFQEVGDIASEAQVMQTVAQIHLEMDKPAEAVVAAGAAVGLWKKSEDRKKLVEAHVFNAQMNLAVGAMGTGKDAPRGFRKGATKGLKAAKEALSLAKKDEDKFLLGMATYTVAQAQVAMANHDEALKGSNQAVEIFREVKAMRAEADSIVLVAEAHLAKGDGQKAVQVAESGMTLAQKVKDAAVESRAVEIIQRVQGVPQQFVPDFLTQGPAAVEAGDSGAIEAKAGLDPEHVRSVVSATALGALASDEEIMLDSPLMETGMDSLSSVAFRNSLNQQLSMNLPAALMFDYPSQRAIVDHVIERSKE